MRSILQQVQDERGACAIKAKTVSKSKIPKILTKNGFWSPVKK